MKQHQRSIITFSGLLLLIFLIVSAGTYLTVAKVQELWLGGDLANFINLSNSIALSVSIMMDHAGPSGAIPPEDESKLQQILRTTGFDSRDRVYLLSRHETRRLFPEKTGAPGQNQPVLPVSEWLEGWQGKRFITAPYKSGDGKESKASILPLPVDSSEPEYVVIVERTTSSERSVQRICAWLKAFILIGAAGFAGLLVFYARSLLSPFKSLEKKLLAYGGVSVPHSSSRTDELTSAIQMFDHALNELKSKKEDLANLQNALERNTQRTGEMEATILNSAGSGMFSFDQQRRLISMSAQAASLLNQNSEKALGKTADDLFGRNSIVATMLLEGLNNHATYKQTQWKMQLPGQSPKWVSLSTFLIRGDFGQTSGIGFIVGDITEWKSLEEQVREHEHLAALGELSAGIAHEIRNPLGAVQGNAEFLAEELTDPKLRDAVNDIREQVTTLNRIVTDFLRFARPARPAISACNLIDILEELVREVNINQAGRIEATLLEESAISFIQGDESILRQVFQNALDNSVQAISGHGNIRISVTPSHLVASGGKNSPAVLICIEDSGSGILPEDFPKLFKPFFSTKTSGTGLGLAIAKRMILLHNGTIEFEPGLQSGSRLKITIPVEFDQDRTFDLKNPRN